MVICLKYKVSNYWPRNSWQRTSFYELYIVIYNDSFA